MDDRKNLPDHETLTPLIHYSPKPDSGNLQKKSCFIHMLQGDMQRVLGEQQFSTASFIAAEVNDELIDRFVALECVAKNVKIDLMHRPEAFAPIRDVQQRMSWVMTLLTLFTLLAGSLTWWMLRRQLAGNSQLQC